MRRTVSIIVCVLMAGFCAGLNAQQVPIPERPLFQPGSYAVPHGRFVQPPIMVYTLPSAEDANNHGTEWERRFSPQVTEPMTAQPLPPPQEVPHLQFIYNHWTGRFHVVPYEPGYAANPSAFPVQTSPLHVWVSSKSSVAQPRPQVQYMCYHDPDPIILPAEIRLRGSRFSVPFTQMQPVPMPVPRPESARPINPSRTQLGERLRQTFGAFVVQ